MPHQSSPTLDVIQRIQYDQISLCDQPAISEDQHLSQSTTDGSTFAFPLSSHCALVFPAYYLTSTALHGRINDEDRAHSTCVDRIGVQSVVGDDVNGHRFRLEVVVQLLCARRFA